MIAKAYLCLATVVLCSALCAQDDPEPPQPVDQIGEYFAKLDADKDGKVTVDEVHATAEAQAGAEATTLAKLTSFGSYLVDHVIADQDDDGLVTEMELRQYISDLNAKTRRLRVSRKDFAVLEKEYLDAYIAESLNVYDKDKDGYLSRTEALANKEINEAGWVELDIDGDGRLGGEEYKHVYRGLVRAAYSLEESPSDINPRYVPANVKQEFAGLDTNGDGEATLAEVEFVSKNANSAKQYWWGAFVRFLAMDTTGDSKVLLTEYFLFSEDVPPAAKHKLFPDDKAAAMDLIWADLDTDKDAAVSKDEYAALPLDTSKFDDIDKDKNNKLSKDEVWNALMAMFATTYEYVDDGSGKTVEDPDPRTGKELFALYTKVGRSWTVKYTTTIEGMEPIVQYTKTEVLEAGPTWAKIRITTLNADKQRTPAKPLESRIEFKSGEAGERDNIAKITEETIKVEAGEFECSVVSVQSDGEKTTMWISKKYPQLTIKLSISGVAGTDAELVEFVE
ncbi:MAG: hypothetical protein H6839_12960 [Planctomycetes bacterium]|nr:hypothetical protein [Planctomycetota bacterium]